MEDAQIVALYWQRDEEAIRQTQQKYSAYLAGIAKNILIDGEDSREAVNDTYLAAWNSMPENRPARLSAYLGKITRQISIDLFRKKNSKKRQSSQYALSLEELGDCLSGGSGPEEQLDAIQLGAAISRFVSGLPENTRRLFVGRYYFFDSLKTAAAYCGMSQAKAKSLLYRTRQSLKAYLEKEGYIL